jgi:rsbT antagonist protein RsbS
MQVPILKQADVLIATVQAALSDNDLIELRNNLAGLARRHRSRSVIVDVTLLDVIDSFAARALRGIAQMTQLLGARTIIVGIQPDVAFSMVQLGLGLEGTTTALDLEEGLALVREHTQSDGDGHGK